jgi:hypothetical protein
MSLKYAHEIFVASKEAVTSSPTRGPLPGCSPTKADMPQDRWASCDDLIPEEDGTAFPSAIAASSESPTAATPASTTADNNSTTPTIDWDTIPLKLEPDPESLIPHLKQYIGYQDEYGRDWVTGLKLEFGLDEGHALNIHVVDIGLVPITYINCL